MKNLLYIATFFLCFTARAGFFYGVPYNPIVLPVAIDTTGMNQIDSTGARTGMWKEEHHYYVVFQNYSNGVLNGISVAYSSSDMPEGCYFLSDVSFYNNGERRGSVYLFYPNGRLGAYIVNLMKDSSSEFYTLKSYIYEYNEDGSLRCEGWSLFGDDIEIDEQPIGVWKFYRVDGSYYEKDYGDEE